MLYSDTEGMAGIFGIRYNRIGMDEGLIECQPGLKLTPVQQSTQRIDISSEGNVLVSAVNDAYTVLKSRLSLDDDKNALFEDRAIRRLKSSVDRWSSLEVKLSVHLTNPVSPQAKLFDDAVVTCAAGKALIGQLHYQSRHYDVAMDILEQACPHLMEIGTGVASPYVDAWMDCYISLADLHSKRDHIQKISGLEARLSSSMPWLKHLLEANAVDNQSLIETLSKLSSRDRDALAEHTKWAWLVAEEYRQGMNGLVDEFTSAETKRRQVAVYVGAQEVVDGVVGEYASLLTRPLKSAPDALVDNPNLLKAVEAMFEHFRVHIDREGREYLHVMDSIVENGQESLKDLHALSKSVSDDLYQVSSGADSNFDSTNPASSSITDATSQSASVSMQSISLTSSKEAAAGFQSIDAIVTVFEEFFRLQLDRESKRYLSSSSSSSFSSAFSAFKSEGGSSGGSSKEKARGKEKSSSSRPSGKSSTKSASASSKSSASEKTSSSSRRRSSSSTSSGSSSKGGEGEKKGSKSSKGHESKGFKSSSSSDKRSNKSGSKRAHGQDTGRGSSQAGGSSSGNGKGKSSGEKSTKDEPYSYGYTALLVLLIAVGSFLTVKTGKQGGDLHDMATSWSPSSAVRGSGRSKRGRHTDTSGGAVAQGGGGLFADAPSGGGETGDHRLRHIRVVGEHLLALLGTWAQAAFSGLQGMATQASDRCVFLQKSLSNPDLAPQKCPFYSQDDLKAAANNQDGKKEKHGSKEKDKERERRSRSASNGTAGAGMRDERGDETAGSLSSSSASATATGTSSTGGRKSGASSKASSSVPKELNHHKNMSESETDALMAALGLSSTSPSLSSGSAAGGGGGPKKATKKAIKGTPQSNTSAQAVVVAAPAVSLVGIPDEELRAAKAPKKTKAVRGTDSAPAPALNAPGQSGPVEAHNTNVSGQIEGQPLITTSVIHIEERACAAKAVAVARLDDGEVVDTARSATHEVKVPQKPMLSLLIPESMDKVPCDGEDSAVTSIPIATSPSGPAPFSARNLRSHSVATSGLSTDDEFDAGGHGKDMLTTFESDAMMAAGDAAEKHEDDDEGWIQTAGNSGKSRAMRRAKKDKALQEQQHNNRRLDSRSAQQVRKKGVEAATAVTVVTADAASGSGQGPTRASTAKGSYCAVTVNSSELKPPSTSGPLPRPATTTANAGHHPQPPHGVHPTGGKTKVENSASAAIASTETADAPPPQQQQIRLLRRPDNAIPQATSPKHAPGAISSGPKPSTKPVPQSSARSGAGDRPQARGGIAQERERGAARAAVSAPAAGVAEEDAEEESENGSRTSGESSDCDDSGGSRSRRLGSAHSEYDASMDGNASETASMVAPVPILVHPQAMMYYPQAYVMPMTGYEHAMYDGMSDPTAFDRYGTPEGYQDMLNNSTPVSPAPMHPMHMMAPNGGDMNGSTMSAPPFGTTTTSGPGAVFFVPHAMAGWDPAAVAASMGYQYPYYPMSSPVPSPMAQVPVEVDAAELVAALKAQIEYYFSPANLCHDLYLCSKMDEEGYVLLQEISQFRRILNLCATPQMLLEAVQSSSKLDVVELWAVRTARSNNAGLDSLSPKAILGTRIRSAEEPMRWVALKQANSSPSTSLSVATPSLDSVEASEGPLAAAVDQSIEGQQKRGAVPGPKKKFSKGSSQPQLLSR